MRPTSAPRIRPATSATGISFSLSGLVGRVRLAMERGRQRRDLLELTDRELRDIGLTRRQALREAARPFWD
ncbi:DUF1127 domain-containing protein [Aquibium carbonis]|nr:DUF1127 domain-containing protein [Aquibium carbonis]